MSTIVICGKEYELTDEPIHGIVRALKNRQKDITFKFLFDNKDLFEDDKNMTIDKAVEVIATKRPSSMAEYSNSLEEFDRMGTLSLATGHLFKEDDVFNMKESEFQEIYKKCSEAIGGGGMKYFFGGLKPNISSGVKGQKSIKTILPPAKKSK